MLEADRRLVAEHWPHLAALVATLDALDGRTVTVTANEADEDLDATLRRRERMAAPVAP